MPRHLLLSGLVLLSPLLQPAAYAQPTNWRVTILQITSADWQDPDCVNASVTVTIPGPTGVGFADLCGGRASLTVAAQNVTLEFTGEKDITLEGIATCHWTITTPVRGKGFISGGAVPATSMTGTANTDCGAIGNFQNEVDGIFQAQRVAVGGGIAITNFTGDVEITLPGQAPVILTPVNAAGLVLPTGTRIHVRAGSSLKLAASGGSVEMGENTELALFTARFFLLVPSFKPLQNSFLKITWRCIPTVGGCASLAMPNTRLAFLPPLRPQSRIGASADATEEDVTLTITYSQAGGLGTSGVTVETGRVEVQNLAGESTLVGAGQEHQETSLVAGAVPLNLNGDTAPDVFRYDAGSGEWAVELAGGGPSVTGMWASGWAVAPGDFDGNGLTDILRHDVTSGRALIALNDGQGGFTELAQEWPPGWRSHVLNLNGDRSSDVFLHEPTTGQWIQAINEGLSSTFQNHTGQWASGWVPHPLDLDADDVVDLLLFNPTSGQWSWALNDGAGGFTRPASGEWSGVTDVYPADFTADGSWDALLYDSRSGAWSLAANSGRDFTYTTGTWADGLDIVVADLDADGASDALLYDRGSGQWTAQISRTLDDGTTQLTPGASGSWGAQWQISATDFNTDGLADFFLFYPEAGLWSKAVNTGAGGFTQEEGSWKSGLTVLSSQNLTQGLLPQDAARAFCAAEADLRSVGATGTQALEFINASSQPRQIHWLNSLGRRVLYHTLAPGQRYVQSSPGADVWVVTDSIGTCQAIYLAGEVPGKALLR